MTPTEREAFEKWLDGRPGGGGLGGGRDNAELAAEWGIAYERKRAAGIAREMASENEIEDDATKIAVKIGAGA